MNLTKALSDNITSLILAAFAGTGGYFSATWSIKDDINSLAASVETIERDYTSLAKRYAEVERKLEEVDRDRFNATLEITKIQTVLNNTIVPQVEQNSGMQERLLQIEMGMIKIDTQFILLREGGLFIGDRGPQINRP